MPETVLAAAAKVHVVASPGVLCLYAVLSAFIGAVSLLLAGDKDRRWIAGVGALTRAGLLAVYAIVRFIIEW